MLPEVERVDRDRRREADDPERGHAVAASEPAGQRGRGERARDGAEHRQEQYRALAADERRADTRRTIIGRVVTFTHPSPTRYV